MTLFEHLQRTFFGDYHQSEAWDMAAPFYDWLQPWAFRLLGVLGDCSYRHYAEAMVESLGCESTALILDAACGSGFLHTAIANRLAESGQCHAVDFSAGMLQRAKAKLPSQAVNRFNFHRRSLYDLDHLFPARKFDGACLSFTLAVLAHPERALAQISRVLKPSRRLVVSTLSREQLDQLKGWKSRRVLVHRYRDRYLAWSDLEQLFLSAGFESCITRSIGWTSLITATTPQE